MSNRNPIAPSAPNHAADPAGRLEERAQRAVQFVAETLEKLHTAYEAEPFRVPYPFSLHLGNGMFGAQADANLPAPPPAALAALRELRREIEPERKGMLRGELTGEGFLRYVQALCSADSRYSETRAYPDLVIDVLLRVQRATQTESGLLHTHHFTATPAAMLPKLIRFGEITASDHVKDLGCGNGRLVGLIHLATGSTASGVELIPKLAEQGRALMNRNRLANVTISQGNALESDLSEATVIVMYAPFYSRMFREMVTRLEERACKGPLRVLLHGPMETFLQESRHFRKHPDSGTLMRFDGIPDQVSGADADLVGASLPSARRRRKDD